MPRPVGRGWRGLHAIVASSGGRHRHFWQLPHGAGQADIYDDGFFPELALLPVIGAQVELGSPPALLLGADGIAWLAFETRHRIPNGIQSHDYGDAALALMLGGREAFSGDWQPLRLDAGLEMGTLADTLF